MLQRRTMGWRDRDYAKWSDEERLRFYGSGASAGSSQNVLAGYEGSPRETRNRIFRLGVGPAILISGLLFAAGHFPVGHPILPFLHFTIRAPHSSATRIRATETINTPSTATVGSTLTFHGTAPGGNGPVTVEGSYDGGKTWETLSSVRSANGSYAAAITLDQRGPFQIQIVFSDGSKAVASLVVE